MLCLHQQENKHIFTPKCNGSQLVVYQTKNTARDKRTDYSANYKSLVVLQKIASFKVTATLSQSHLNHP